MAETFTPRYRVGINIEATGVCTSVLFEGAQAHNSMTTQVSQAISYARTVHASRDDIEITLVMRQAKEDGPWEQVVSAYRAVPGTQVKIVGWDRPLHRVNPRYEERVDWVTVGRWQAMGNGKARLITTDGRVMGEFSKEFVFITR